MIKGAIFDVDGTLLDSMWIWQETFRSFMERHHVPVPEGANETMFHLSLGEAAGYIYRELNVGSSGQEVLDEIWQIARSLYGSGGKLKPGAYDFLADLKANGVPMVIVTSGEREMVASTFAGLGIDHYFTEILAATNEGVSKREPDLYLRAADIMGAQPRDTWVFEDALYAISVVRGLGFHAIGIEDGQREKDREQILAKVDDFWPKFPEKVPALLLQ